MSSSLKSIESTPTSTIAVLLLRNDLRLCDNLLFHTKEVMNASQVLAVYCFDSRLENARTRRFREQALFELRATFRENFNGAHLACFDRKPEKVVPEIVKLLRDKGTVMTSEEPISFEKRIDKRVEDGIKTHGWDLKKVWNYSLYHPDDLPFDVRKGDLPEPFTAMRNTIEGQNVPVRAPVEIPKLNAGPHVLKDPQVPLTSIPGFFEPRELPGNSPNGFEDAQDDTPSHYLTFRGGEMAAWNRLGNFVQTGLSKYKTIRNGSIGYNYSTKLSPYLAAGCISPRQVHHRIRQFEEVNGETVHSYWVIFELLWRDFLRFFGMKHGDELFHELGPAGVLPRGVQWAKGGRETQRRLDLWKHGATGVPWIDGHMRELLRTGFMSNRGRQNVASFLVHNLNVDWRHGAQYFQEQLIDHDVTSNWGNWVSAAGIGSRGSRVNRFNPDKQARDYDKNAEHARLWIPELASIPGHLVHDLALRSSCDGLDKYRNSSAEDLDGLNIGQSYPQPVVKINKSVAAKSEKRHPGKKRVHKGKNKTFYTS